MSDYAKPRRSNLWAELWDLRIPVLLVAVPLGIIVAIIGVVVAIAAFLTGRI